MTIIIVGCVCCVVGVTFTPMNVLKAVQEVKDTDELGIYLNVPKSERQEIYGQFFSVVDQRKSLIQYWMDRDLEASWRGLIVALDRMREKTVADKLRHLAEPVTGSWSMS